LASISLFLFGSPRLERDERPVHMDTRKALALLAYLVMSSQSHTRDTLATLLWPDYDQTNARAAFRRTLSTLNKALDMGTLKIERELVGINEQAKIYVDVLRFLNLLAESHAHKHFPQEACQECLSLLNEAVQLYEGDFMAGFTLRDSPSFDDWQFFESESLRQELGEALQNLALGLAHQSEYTQAIAHARRWLALDPLREEAHRLLMKLFEWSGQRGAALRQYRECVRVLDQELGVHPLEETTRVYQAILENNLPKPTQHLPPPLETVFEIEKAAGSLVRQTSAYPLVGREHEWQAIIDAYQSAHTDGYLCLIEGETGIGKTRLTLEFLNHIRQTGAPIFQARCYEGETDLAYGPIIAGFSALLKQQETAERLTHLPEHWLGEASRLIPEISTISGVPPPSTSLEGPGARVRFFEGLRQVLITLLTNTLPGVLFLDDLHWADAATADFLTYLTRRIKGTHILVLVTLLKDSLSTVPHLSQLYTEIGRMSEKYTILLGRLTPDDLSDLIRFSMEQDSKINDDFAARLYQESEGLPLIAVEYLGGIAHQETRLEDLPWRIPGSVRDVLRARLTGMDETSEQLLSTAAVIGRNFDFNTLREVSGRSEAETVNGLETLLERALIREERKSKASIEITYDFIHEKLRTLVYDDTSLARRRLLHRRVAEVLSNPSRGREPGIPSLIAHHFKLAAQEAQAAEYYKLAGEHARALHAHVDAIAHFHASLASGYLHPAELHEAIGDMHTLTGEYAAAITSYEIAAALSALEDLPNLEYKLGNVHHRLGNWELAECHFQVTLDEIGESGDAALRSRTYADWSRTAHYRGQADQALSLAQKALQLAQESDDTPARAQASNILGMLSRSEGDHAQAIEYLNQSLAEAETLEDPRARIDALNNLAMAHFDAGESARAITLTQNALDLCTRHGDRHREAALLNNLADLLNATGKVEESMDSLKKSLTIFSEIGVDAGSMKAEIWKLVEW
jgi:predicted ATPase/DNA-binding SARP family transcriptional activator